MAFPIKATNSRAHSHLAISLHARQVFTKAYNKTNKLSLNAWTQEDADFYVKDMEQKLGYYFNNEKYKSYEFHRVIQQ